MTPMVVILLILVPICIPLIWLVVIYNRLTSVRYHLQTSWSDVDVELKRRYDLVPNLVNVVKGYAEHEKETLERLTELRNTAAANNQRPDLQSDDEMALERGLGEVMVVAEAFPDLKADAGFLSLQRELANTEDRIAAARRFYNANVRELNQLCRTFPSSLAAGWFGFEPQGFFEAEREARDAPVAGVGD
ncbi:MAG: hypothetical protein CMJ34_02055 [Phycisphaerae bacterium]|nr:hypothetical protein [Phycisphaerae bacterium]